jgi:5-methylcytosine-specific restriction enzyme B
VNSNEENLGRYLADRYGAYLAELPDKEWMGAYQRLCERTKQIASKLKGEGREQLVQACSQVPEAGGLDNYMRELWYERDNGVASLRQGGVSLQMFEQMMADVAFWKVVSQGIALAREPAAADPADAYQTAVDWMRGFAASRQIRAFHALINRFFATCLPGVTSTIVAEGHFRALVTQLDTAAVAELQGDWLRVNQKLIDLLNAGLAGRTLNDDSVFRRSIFFWWLYENMAGGYEDPQVIFYGSPGTGKTWKATRIAKARIAAWAQDHAMSARDGTAVQWHAGGPEETLLTLVQFHPSFGYEEFVEGIRPSGSDEGRIQLRLSDGVFKEFCRRAARWEIEFWRDTGGALTEETPVAAILDRQMSRRETWQFMLSQPPEAKIVDHLPPYFFVIDEVNRAELSRVLGELMFALEYRGAANKIKTQYSTLVRSDTDPGAFLVHGDTNYFFVPFNIFVFGTMNTIDRSVESFDFALRRRFRWVNVEPDPMAARHILEKRGFEETTVKRAVGSLVRLNEMIGKTPFLGPDYRIGHAYMERLSKYDGPGGATGALAFLWENHLKPLLQEYLRGRGREPMAKQLEPFQKAFLGG